MNGVSKIGMLGRVLALWAFVTSGAVAAGAGAGPAGDPPGKSASAPAKPVLTWRQSERSVALLNNGRMVWEHVHDKAVGKPYMRFGLLDGTELTRPWPFTKEYPKNDHVWHRALWWSWKYINGVNYWEGLQTGTEPAEATVATRLDGSATIDLPVSYHEPDKAPVVLEKRTLRVSAPDADGSYFIDWETTFTPGGDQDVRFNKNSYGGFALRLAAECCGDTARKIPAWIFSNDKGDKDCNNKAARWVAYQGKTPNGQATCVAIFDHPENPRHPVLWQTRGNYPYMNPSLTCAEDYVLAAGKSLRLKYRVLVHVGALDARGLDAQWETYAKAK